MNRSKTRKPQNRIKHIIEGIKSGLVHVSIKTCIISNIQ